MKTNPKCSVQGCENPATRRVMLVDFKDSYPGDGWFREQDLSCPYLCEAHRQENDASVVWHGRTPEYRYTKWGPDWSRSGGWTEYVPLVNSGRGR